MGIEKPLERNLPLQRLVREEYLPGERNSYRITYIQSSILVEKIIINSGIYITLQQIIILRLVYDWWAISIEKKRVVDCRSLARLSKKSKKPDFSNFAYDDFKYL